MRQRFSNAATEAEWEYACRAGMTGDRYSYANVDDIGWHSGNSANKTHAVGGKQPNAFGVYDMLADLDLLEGVE